MCYYVIDIDTLTSAATRKSFKIKDQLNCDDRCVIYFLNILGKLRMTLDIDGTITIQVQFYEI